jgi:lytic murein transglycosylase
MRALMTTPRHRVRFMALVAMAIVQIGACASAGAADVAFQKWLAELWPEVQAMGVTRATFDAATRNLEPDYSLPDLVIPGRERAPPSQPEFVLTPADYVKETTIARLAGQGKKLLEQHRVVLARIDQEFGVPPTIILAIWGRETAFGGYNLPHDTVRVLATQGFVGRRKDMFRQELLAALKILHDGHISRAEMKSSWAGAMGLTQFLPSEFYKYAVDFDGDGKADIWRSVPDALASAGKQLAGKGWQRGKRWAYEVRAPANVDCTIAEPSVTAPIGEWVKRGYQPAFGRTLSREELAETASLLMPEGLYGPAFLTPKNYYVIKDYNFSDLYVLFVGHLSDRIGDGRPFEARWSKDAQLRTAAIEAMQRRLTDLGFYRDKIDGKAGMLTRSALGAYQKANGLKLDCWPTAAVVDHMQRNAAR